MTRRTCPVAAILFLVPVQTLAIQATRSAAPDDGTSADALRATIELERIRAARDAFEADRLVERAARIEMRGGGDAEAEPLYARALQLDPTNHRARQGLAATRERLGLVVAPEPSPLMERSRRELNARRQEAMYRFDGLLESARDGIAKGSPEGFEAARLQLARARLLRAARAGLFSADELASLETRIAEHELAVMRTSQARADAELRAAEREAKRRIKEARVHDKRLGL